MNEVKELVEELRNKKSRDNRELLDRSADMIEKLAKELCEKSGCHHKCHDTTDCVVEDEALLLINENKSNNSDFKSNNFEVKSNEELFKQALVEGLNRHFDRKIEEAKKIEQIEEMAKAIHEVENLEWLEDTLAEALYNSGYRKQSEWISVEDRLPEPNAHVLLYAFFHNQWQIVKGWHSYCDKKFHIVNSDYPSLTDVPVTHWMPLPEAPKMTRKEDEGK